jgi:hypothetical protein
MGSVPSRREVKRLEDVPPTAHMERSRCYWQKLPEYGGDGFGQIFKAGKSAIACSVLLFLQSGSMETA